jgi:CopG family nickel-responsive transcriptional regulator
MLSRVGISLDEELLKRFDEVIEEKGYDNRSEAIRDLIRDTLVEKEWDDENNNETRVAIAIIVYDHDEHDLGHKITHIQHHSHDIVISTTHVHLDIKNCLEVLLLKGKSAQLKKFGNALISTNGVKMGKLILATTGQNF